MKDSKLVRYLQTFTKDEVKALSTFIKRKTTNSTLFSLYKRIIQQHPNYEALDEKKLLKDVVDTNGKSLSIKQLQTNLSKLASSVASFIVYQEIQNESALQKNLEIEAFLKRGLYEEFQRKAVALIEELEQKQSYDTSDYYLLFKLYHDYFFHPFTEKFKTDATLINKSVAYFHKFNLLVQLRILSESLIRQQILDTKVLIVPLETMLPVLKEYQEPVFRIYTQLLEILQLSEPNDSLITFKEDLQDNINFLSHSDRNNIVQKLVIRLYYFYERGQLNYLQHIHELYQLADRHNFILYNNTLSHNMYISIVVTAAGVSDFQWAKYAMAKYFTSLNKYISKYTHIFAQASCFFFQEDYNKTKELLDALLFDHVSIRLQAEMLYLRTYYELIIRGKAEERDFDLCKDRLSLYIARSDKVPFSKERETSLVNFIYAMKKMINYYYLSDKKEETKEKLRLELTELSPMYSKGWIYQKMKYLK